MVCCSGHILREFSFPPGDNVEIRPWGAFKTHYLAEDKSVCYKTLWVNTGEQLSLQYHNKRSELWYIPDENSVFRMTQGNSVKICRGRNRFYIGVGENHTIMNMSSLPLVIHETQMGYCDEMDIVRLYDPYNRQ